MHVFAERTVAFLELTAEAPVESKLRFDMSFDVCSALGLWKPLYKARCLDRSVITNVVCRSPCRQLLCDLIALADAWPFSALVTEHHSACPARNLPNSAFYVQGASGLFRSDQAPFRRNSVFKALFERTGRRLKNADF